MGPIYDSELDADDRMGPIYDSELDSDNRMGPIYGSELDADYRMGPIYDCELDSYPPKNIIWGLGIQTEKNDTELSYFPNVFQSYKYQTFYIIIWDKMDDRLNSILCIPYYKYIP